MTDRQRNGFILILVLGLVLASLVVIVGVPGATNPKKTVLGLDLKGGVELVYQGQPSAQTPKVTPDALTRAVDIMRSRVDQLGVAEPQIQTTGNQEITVGLPNVTDTARAEREVGTTAQLAFYDWENNVITPNGKTVASQLQSQDPTATTTSQGTGGSSPGSPGSGSMALYDAVKLAAKQPYSASSANSRTGNQYWMFGAPGQLGVRGRRQGKGDHADGRPALPALGSRRQPDRSEVGRSARCQRLGGGDRDGPARNRGAPVDPVQLRQVRSDRQPAGAVLRAQGQHLAPGERHHQPGAGQRSQHGRARRHVRVQLQGQEGLPGRDGADRAARKPGQRPWPVARTSISRWRSTTS